jgi:hypothetical protein
MFNLNSISNHLTRILTRDLLEADFKARTRYSKTIADTGLRGNNFPHEATHGSR